MEHEFGVFQVKFWWCFRRAKYLNWRFHWKYSIGKLTKSLFIIQSFRQGLSSIVFFLLIIDPIPSPWPSNCYYAKSCCQQLICCFVITLALFLTFNPFSLEFCWHFLLRIFYFQSVYSQVYWISINSINIAHFFPFSMIDRCIATQ